MYIESDKQLKNTMRKIIFHLDTDTVGTAGHEAVAFDDDVTEKEIEACGWQLALANAEMYGIYPLDAQPEDYDKEDTDWQSDEYSDAIEFRWEDYDPKKHDDLVPGGGE